MDLDLENELIHVGALVDAVVAVREIDDDEIKPAPSIGDTYKSEFISGVVKFEETFIMILDLIKLFTSEELVDLKKRQEKNNSK